MVIARFGTVAGVRVRTCVIASTARCSSASAVRGRPGRRITRRERRVEMGESTSHKMSSIVSAKLAAIVSSRRLGKPSQWPR